MQDLKVYFEYGNHYRYEASTKQEAHFKSAHNWTAFFRCSDPNDSIETFVEKVVFTIKQANSNKKPITVMSSEALSKDKKNGSRKGEI